MSDLEQKIFFRKNGRKMTKSGSLVTTVKEKKSKISKTIFFHELSDLEQKNFFRILDHPKFSKTEPHLELKKNGFQIFFGPEIFRECS